jgi:DNA-directed RNA polymerase beta' subunit
VKKEVKKLRGNSELTRQERQRRFADFRAKCLGCKRAVGMVFSQTANQLAVVCGAAAEGIEPCPLRIVIDKGKSVDLYQHTASLKKKVNGLMSVLNRIKLDLLFQFKNEDATIARFEEVRPQYEETDKKYQEQLKEMIEIMEHVSQDEEIQINKDAVYEVKQEIKNAVQEAIKTNSPALIHDAVEVYIDRLLALLEEYQKLNFPIYEMERVEDGSEVKHHLVARPYSLAEMSVYEKMEQPKVVAFQK